MEVDNTDITNVTPSKKKLKQARLPFKIISDSTTLPDSPVSRKRKLSSQENDLDTKIGKFCKENETDMVVISDDENNEEPSKNEENPVNPLINLVEKAYKKKIQKLQSPEQSKKKHESTKKKEERNKQKNNPTDSGEKSDKQDVEENKQSDIDNCVNNTDKIIDTDNVKTNKENEVSDESMVISDDDDTSKTKEKTESPKVNVVDSPSMKRNTRSTRSSTQKEAKNDKDTKEKEENGKKDHTEKISKEVKDTKLEKNNSEENSDECETPDKDKKLDKSIISSKENETFNSTDITALSDDEKHDQSSSSKDKTIVTPSLTDSAKKRQRARKPETPDQIQKRLDSAKKKEEREKEKIEREKKRQQEKEERERLKLEKEEQKKKEKEEKEKQRELEKKLKEEKEEQKRKEREEKEEQKRKEKEEKEEQKRKEKEAKDEEKRKKQEAVELEKQEQELKKMKAAKAFVNFFVPKQKVEKESQFEGYISKSSILSSFTVKSDMRLAPIVRCQIGEQRKDNLDNLMEVQKENRLYLNCLKDSNTTIGSSGKTWPLQDKDDDVVIIEDELPPMEGASEITCEPIVREKLRPKLFSFHDNRRPPYWGTWRKKSSCITPRKPFGQDEKQLDYEVDSDEEWEEEEAGESIDGSRAGSDDEMAEADEYEVDNEVFVPHGYLSDEEATMDEDDVLSLSPEAQKAKLKYLEDEFETEMKKPTEKLKPRLYGLLWETSDGGKPDYCVDALWNYFQKLSMIIVDPAPLFQPSTEPEDTEKKKTNKKKSLPESPSNLKSQDNPKTPKQSDKKKKQKAESKDKKLNVDANKTQSESKKNQPNMNSFLKKLKSP